MQNPETIQVDMQNPETKLASIPDEPDDELRLNLALYLATQLREINCIVHRKHAHYNKLKQVAEELVKKIIEFEARVLKHWQEVEQIVHEQKPKSFSAKALIFWADVDKFWTDPYALSESQYWGKLKLNLMVDEKILLLLLLLLLVHYI